MKLTYEYEPPKYEVLGEQYRLNYNIEQTTETRTDPETGEETIVQVWLCDCVVVDKIERTAIIVALIRKAYTADDELAILRQRDSKQEEFEAYNAYAESCKTIADEWLNL